VIKINAELVGFVCVCIIPIEIKVDKGVLNEHKNLPNMPFKSILEMKKKCQKYNITDLFGLSF
jgi:hypothetical protein